jgi:hypothetical protein
MGGPELRAQTPAPLIGNTLGVIVIGSLKSVLFLHLADRIDEEETVTPHGELPCISHSRAWREFPQSLP